MLVRSYGFVLAVAALAVFTASSPIDEVAAGEVPADHAQQMAASMELFKGHVRELLISNCLNCHGGEATHGEFDLTTREVLLKGGEQGPAIVPGKPAESLLLKLVRHEGEPNMPQDADKLPDEAIEQLTTWIASGAAYDQPLVDAAAEMTAKRVSPEDKQFWSFKPLTTPTVPSDDAWCRTDIDRFVLAKQREKGLKPNPPAERRKLIRRAYFDLVGLPPSPEEVEAFVNENAADAYDKLIDRLLDSPHYGERWGRHWLDLARFAESHGYEQDYDRPTAYHYRDFVIRALNEDMPYDRFVRLQIAGDEFEPANNQALMATGFLGAGTHATQITANQVEKERYDELDDMAATVGTAMLGLTIGCARCHDHKFDPIPQADYYRLVSTFTTTVRSEVELDFHPEIYHQAKADFDAEHAPLAEALDKFEREELPARFEKWLTETKSVMPTWLILDLQDPKSVSGVSFEKLDDGSMLAKGKNIAKDTYTFTANFPFTILRAIRLEALAHDSLPKNGPGRAGNGNFALSDFQVWAAPAGAPSPGAPVKMVNPKVTYEQKGLPIAATIDDNTSSAWAVDGQIGKNQAAAYAIETPVTHPQGSTLTFILKFENNNEHNLGRLRLSVSTVNEAAGPAPDDAKQQEVEAINRTLARPVEERTAEERGTLLEWYRKHDPEWLKLKRAVEDHDKQAPKPKLTKVMIASEGLPAIRLHTQGGDFFENTYFLKRGDLQQKLGVAPQGFLQVLTSADDGEKHWQEPTPEGSRTSYRRRALANWLTDHQQGAGNLLARVIVNRLWRHHLGRGIVATPSDFGASGARPSHPELLDYLAGKLLAEGWRLKPLHKAIMTSAVYLQSADDDPTRLALDPDNQWFWRRSRQRLEAEVIRDAMLAAAGQLDTTLYGPGSLDESHTRRSIYFTIKRSQLVPSMMLYDAPDSLQGLGQRASTIVAPQALAMLNSKQVVDSARAFARRLLVSEGVTDDAAVKQAYAIALARQPDEQELGESLEFVRAASQNYQDAGGQQGRELALADFCQVLFGLNEFIYID